MTKEQQAIEQELENMNDMFWDCKEKFIAFMADKAAIDAKTAIVKMDSALTPKEYETYQVWTYWCIMQDIHTKQSMPEITFTEVLMAT